MPTPTHNDQTPCDDGTYQDQPGMASCRLTPAGTAIPRDGRAHVSQGEQCALGSFTARDGMSECVGADLGFFSADRVTQQPCDEASTKM